MNRSDGQPTESSFQAVNLAVLAWIGALVIAAYGRVLGGLVETWTVSAAEMGHGFLAPVAAGYMIWLKWDKIRQIPVTSSGWGLFLIVWGCFQQVAAMLSKWTFGYQSALMITLVGCLLYLRGVETVRQVAYPLFTLALMIPPPAYLYGKLTLRLQLLAAALAERGLDLTGYTVLREGNILEIAGERMFVAEACSGLRSLTTLLFFFVVYCYFQVPESRIRSLILLLTVPVALLGNAARIMFTAFVASYNRQLAHGSLHEASGYLILILGGLFCIGVHQALRSRIARA